MKSTAVMPYNFSILSHEFPLATMCHFLHPHIAVGWVGVGAEGLHVDVGVAVVDVIVLDVVVGVPGIPIQYQYPNQSPAQLLPTLGFHAKNSPKLNVPYILTIPSQSSPLTAKCHLEQVPTIPDCVGVGPDALVLVLVLLVLVGLTVGVPGTPTQYQVEAHNPVHALPTAGFQARKSAKVKVPYLATMREQSSPETA